ncbi:hypothetical protein GGS26DRAFT_595114 [Hypomontagnella submonticulosa]|nr:hypothetical protein GGS26DRAFT_595114 [Hypomontagnella submonticulosa]
MSSTEEAPNQTFRPTEDIFALAGLAPEVFNANTFLLKTKRVPELQQTDAELFPDREISLRDIGNLAGGICNCGQGSLGKDLLDYFALLFAQPGPEGVVATAMKSRKETNTYTLIVARNDATSDSLGGTADSIKNLFAAEYQNHQVGSSNNLWQDVLRNSSSSIRKFVKETCSGCWGNSSSRRFLGTKMWIQSVAHCIRWEATMAEFLSTFLSTLGQLELYYSNHVVGPEKESAEELLCLDTIVQLCFRLVTLYRTQISGWVKEWNDWLSRVYRMGSNILEKPISELKYERNWQRKLQRLIYTIANYRVSWYHIVHFKRHCTLDGLQISFIPSQDESVPCSTTSRDVEDAGLRPGLPSEGAVESTTTEIETEESQVFLTHCEMRILDTLLGSSVRGDFFNYIRCSKGPCWLCYHTLKYMAPKVGMRKSHMKLYSRWKPPVFKASEQDRKRFAEVLKFLDKEIGRLAKPANRRGLSRHKYQSDCPDIEGRVPRAIGQVLLQMMEEMEMNCPRNPHRNTRL